MSCSPRHAPRRRQPHADRPRAPARGPVVRLPASRLARAARERRRRWSAPPWPPRSGRHSTRSRPPSQRLFDDRDRSTRRQAHAETLRSYHAGVRLMVAVVVAGFLVAMAVLLWLARSLLPRVLLLRTLRAIDLAAGDYAGRLGSRGRDEIDQLGEILDTVAQRRAGLGPSRRRPGRVQRRAPADRRPDRGPGPPAPPSRAVDPGRDGGRAQPQQQRGPPRGRLRPRRTARRCSAALADASPRSCLAVRARRARPRARTTSRSSTCAVCGGSPATRPARRCSSAAR